MFGRLFFRFFSSRLSECITILAIIVSLKAYSLGSASRVGALFAIQPLFVLLFSAIISTFNPLSLNEDISKKSIIYKVIAIVSIMIGVSLVI